MQTLETSRLLIRELTLEDRDACQDLLGQEYDYFWGPGEEAADLGQRVKWIVDLSRWDAAGRLYGDHAVVLRETGAIIGLCGIDPWVWSGKLKRLFPDLFPEAAEGQMSTTIEFELGYALLESHRGRGYATEAVRELIRYAFEEREVAAIYARTDITNERSYAMMKRVGMETAVNEDWGGYVGRLRNPGT